MSALKSGMWGVAGLMLAAASLASAESGTGTQPGEYKAAEKSAVPAAGSSTGSTAETGTQPEEYGSPPNPKQQERVNVSPSVGSPASVQAKQKRPPSPTGAGPGVKSQPQTDANGKKLTGPGAQPGEYEATGGARGKRPAYDSVHNVRIRPDTPHPDSGTRVRRRGDSAR